VSGAVVIDTSALAAIAFDEPEAQWFAETMKRHRGDLHISAATLVETLIVVESRLGRDGAEGVRSLCARLGIEVVSVDERVAGFAFEAWRRFGKGNHSAALNLGDTYSYGTAKALGAELLYKGRDFAQTDIASVL
jgi:ribonuclease VapC